MACFNAGLDVLAKNVGGWPDGATVHTIEVITDGDDPQVLLTGAVPTGAKKNGRLTFDKQGSTFRVVVPLSHYREALS